LFVDHQNIFDMDFQHGFHVGDSQQFVWGLGYRSIRDRNDSSFSVSLQPNQLTLNHFSAFVQDEISLVDKRLRLTFGSKFEHNDFSGYEIQPSGRMAWKITPKHSLWGAISRAVRVPTRLERDIAIDVNAPGSNPQIELLGNRDFKAEKLIAYELGYRWQALQNLFVDIAAFDNHYQDLASLEVGTPFVDPTDGRTIIPIVNRNLTAGRAQGVETLITFSPMNNWRLTVSHSYLDMSLDPKGQDLNRGRFLAGATPRNQFGLRSSLDLPANVQIDAQFRHLSAIESLPEIVNGERDDTTRSGRTQDCALIALVTLLASGLSLPHLKFYSDDWAFLRSFRFAPSQTLLQLYATFTTENLTHPRPVQVPAERRIYSRLLVHRNAAAPRQQAAARIATPSAVLWGMSAESAIKPITSKIPPSNNLTRWAKSGIRAGVAESFFATI